MSHNRITSRSTNTFKAIIIAAMFVFILAVTIQISAVPLRQANSTITGNIFRDYNATGTRDYIPTLNEPGVGGITVTAYISGGLPVSTLSAANGDYTLNFIGIGAGTAVRIEFTGIPDYLRPGPFGANSGTTVIFATTGNANVDVGMANPADFCGSNPELFTSCYALGDQSTITDPVIVSFPYSAGGTALPAIDQPGHPAEATAQQVGTTWGLDYQKASNSIFAAAFMKRHTGFGPGGPGAIYRIDRGSGVASILIDLNSMFASNPAGVDTHPPNETTCPPTNALCFEIDQFSWGPVGKIGFGDLDLSDDERTLWTVNLNDRQLYEIPIGIPPTTPAASNVISYPFNTTGESLADLPDQCPNNNIDIRPFGVAVHDGLVYIGMVCTAESTVPAGFAGGEILPANAPGNHAAMRAYVFSFDPNTQAFTEELNFPLDYARLCAVRNAGVGCDAARWHPWVPVFTVIDTIFNSRNEKIYPQPWVTDIEFDNGDMILGIRDRFGDQMGFEMRSTNPNSNVLYTGDAAGDILRACRDVVSGNWTLENNGLCNGQGGGAAADPNSGPGGREYYYQENYPYHDEVSLGGLLQLPGEPHVVQTIYDPVFSTAQAFDGGIRWFTNTLGTNAKSYRIFSSDSTNPRTFGKGGGLGDLEAICEVAPIEIGNRVWLDQDINGIQDPEASLDEQPIPGVTLSLWEGNTFIASTVTNARGEYYFNDSNVQGGLKTNTRYEIRVDNLADYTAGGPLESYRVTPANQGPSDIRDSDGVTRTIAGFPDGLPYTVVDTGDFGDNDHTYDFGFYNRPPGTAVELVSFAVTQVADRQVDLRWETAAEIDNFGFNLYRAPDTDFTHAQVIHFEPSSIQGSGPGAVYTYSDNVADERIWWYWLADVDTQGQETLHGPVSAVVGVDALLPQHVYLPIVSKGQP